VYLDEHLQWSDHVDAVMGKISKTCGILNKLKNRLPRHVLAIIYQSLILPYLQHCAIVWANCSSYMLDSVYIVQKRAPRIICDLPRRAHTAPYFKKLKLLRDLNPSVIMDHVTVCHMKLNLKKNFYIHKET